MTRRSSGRTCQPRPFLSESNLVGSFEPSYPICFGHPAWPSSIRAVGTGRQGDRDQFRHRRPGGCVRGRGQDTPSSMWAFLTPEAVTGDRFFGRPGGPRGRLDSGRSPPSSCPSRPSGHHRPPAYDAQPSVAWLVIPARRQRGRIRPLQAPVGRGRQHPCATSERNPHQRRRYGPSVPGRLAGAAAGAASCRARRLPSATNLTLALVLSSFTLPWPPVREFGPTGVPLPQGGQPAAPVCEAHQTPAVLCDRR